MKPAKLRLLESTFAGYTGVLCGVEFVEGVSTKELPFVDQQRICASMRAETIEGRNVSASGQFSERHDISLEDAIKTEAKAPKIVPMERGEATPNLQKFTRAELESLADAEGIAGLRLIGNPLGVKAKAIGEMIDGIVKAQGGE